MEFTVYSKEDCPYCYKLKTILELTGSQFKIFKLEEDFSREEFYSLFGDKSTFPQVLCDGKSIGGCSDTIKLLKESMKL